MNFDYYEKTSVERRSLLAPLQRSCASLLIVLLVASAGCGDDDPQTTYQATIRWTENRVPHILASDIPSAAFGQGYAFANLGGCVLADQILKIRSERAQFLGAGSNDVHINSDLLHLALGFVAEAESTYPNQSAEVRDVVAAYVAGFNKFIETNRNRLPCSSEPWLRPISELDLFAHYLELSTFTSGRALKDLIVSAQPPTVGARTMPTTTLEQVRAHRPGSNGWAIGGERTDNGMGMLLANPHFPWEGELKLYESHLRVPGKLDIYGASLMGVVGVLIGFNNDVAWTHTVSDGQRFTLYQLQLDPNNPTAYIYDGTSREMQKVSYSINVRQPDGSISIVTRTLYRSHWGPMLMLPPVGWTNATAFTMRDTNASNPGIVQQILSSNQADSLEKLQQVHDQVSGLPWVNTMAVSKEGRAWYIDSSATPALSAAAIAQYQVLRQTDPLTGFLASVDLTLLPGNDSKFEWVEQSGARSPGLVPVALAPRLERSDFVFNANDSHWLSNPLQPLTGFSPLYGPERTPRSPRTRMNARMLLDEDRSWSGADHRFDLTELQAAVFSNRGLMADLLRDAVVARCRTASAPILYRGQSVDLAPACDALAAWDLRIDLASSGAMLWREFLGDFPGADTVNAGALFAEPFDPGTTVAISAVETPRGLAAAAPGLAAQDDRVVLALAGAVVRLRLAGLTPTSTAGAAQFTQRGSVRVPIHGGGSQEGIINIVLYADNLMSTVAPAMRRGPVINPITGLTADGYPVNAGSSFVMTMQFTDRGPTGQALLTYGQSDDAASPYHVDQTQRFSTKQWRTLVLTEEDIAGDAGLLLEDVSGPRKL
jgi:acyl-homoserine-lactone acylase